jgi:two-component system KDP operon response regulator KdpE
MMPLKAMVAETDEPTGERLRVLLEGLGFKVELAPTGRALLDRAAQVRPDLILVDLYLPDLLGTIVCHELRGNSGRLTPIVITSFKTYPLEAEIASAAGADALLRKPIQDEQVQITVVRLVRESGGRR